MKTINTQARPFYAAIILSLWAALLLPGSAVAHLDLKSSSPVRDEILEKSPELVQLWFNEELDSFESSVAVFDSNNIQVDLGDYKVNSADRTEMQVSLPNNLTPGVYTIKWNAVDDEDGHPLEGEIEFTIKGALPLVDQQVTSNPSSVLYTFLLGGIIVFGVLLFLQREKKNSS